MGFISAIDCVSSGCFLLAAWSPLHQKTGSRATSRKQPDGMQSRASMNLIGYHFDSSPLISRAIMVKENTTPEIEQKQTAPKIDEKNCSACMAMGAL